MDAASVPDRPDFLTVLRHMPSHVTLDQTETSNHNLLGDRFGAAVSEAAGVDGKTVIPQALASAGRWWMDSVRDNERAQSGLG
jgi:hypothetical protein